MFRLTENFNIIIEPEILLIPEIEALSIRDKDKDKLNFKKELKYIFLMCDNKSPYFNKSLSDKAKIIGKDIFNNENYTPDELVVAAMNKYKLLKVSPTMILLESANQAIYTLANRLKSDSTSTKDILSSLKQLRETVISYDSLKLAVEKEETKMKTKNNTKRGNREVPK